MAELAAPAAPVLLVLLLGALLRQEAEVVERLAADLAVDQLAGTDGDGQTGQLMH